MMHPKALTLVTWGRGEAGEEVGNECLYIAFYL